MISHRINIAPRYVETDQMGIVHHSNYLIYFEMGRLAWLDNLGFSYASLEEQGYMLPVHKIEIDYNLPMKFGHSYKLETIIQKNPTNRIVFNYLLTTSAHHKCASGTVILVFTRKRDFKPCRPHRGFVEACEKYFISPQDKTIKDSKLS